MNNDLNTHLNTHLNNNIRSNFPMVKEPSQWLEFTTDQKELIEGAEALIQRGDHKRAISFLSLILAKEPHHQVLLERVAQCATEIKDFALAIDCYQKLISVYGGQEYKIYLAEALYNSGQNDLALDLYLDLKPQLEREALFVALKNMGHISILKKSFEEAREYYEEALEISPVSDELRLYYGVLEVQEGRSDEALKWFRSAIELNSQNELAWICLALLHNEYGDLDLAWGNLEKALDINPTHEMAFALYFEWGLMHHQMKSVLNRCESIVDQYPEETRFKVDLAKVQFCIGYFDESQESLKSISVSDPLRAEAMRLCQLIHSTTDMEVI